MSKINDQRSKRFIKTLASYILLWAFLILSFAVLFTSFRYFSTMMI